MNGFHENNNSTSSPTVQQSPLSKADAVALTQLLVATSNRSLREISGRVRAALRDAVRVLDHELNCSDETDVASNDDEQVRTHVGTVYARLFRVIWDSRRERLSFEDAPVSLPCMKSIMKTVMADARSGRPLVTESAKAHQMGVIPSDADLDALADYINISSSGDLTFGHRCPQIDGGNVSPETENVIRSRQI